MSNNGPDKREIAEHAVGGPTLATNFDFLLGNRRIKNRKLKTLLPEEERAGWFEFESTAEARPILGGQGIVDTYAIPEFPGRGDYHALALRLVNPSLTSGVSGGRQASSRAGSTRPSSVVSSTMKRASPAKLGTRAATCSFGRSTRRSLRPSLRWEQAFSFDGTTFETNWIRRFHRSPGR